MSSFGEDFDHCSNSSTASDDMLDLFNFEQSIHEQMELDQSSCYSPFNQFDFQSSSDTGSLLGGEANGEYKFDSLDQNFVDWIAGAAAGENLFDVSVDVNFQLSFGGPSVNDDGVASMEIAIGSGVGLQVDTEGNVDLVLGVTGPYGTLSTGLSYGHDEEGMPKIGAHARILGVGVGAQVAPGDGMANVYEAFEEEFINWATQGQL